MHDRQADLIKDVFYKERDDMEKQDILERDKKDRLFEIEAEINARLRRQVDILRFKTASLTRPQARTGIKSCSIKGTIRQTARPFHWIRLRLAGTA